MRRSNALARRLLAAALLVSGALSAQAVRPRALTVCGGGCVLAPSEEKPALQPLRVAGALGASAVGFTVGTEGGLLFASGLSYLLNGHSGDITTPGMKRATTAILVAGGGLGAGTGAWLVSRANRQTSNWAWDVGASTVVTAFAFRYAGWPMTLESRRRPMSRWRRMAPVWMSAITATVAASASRARR